MLDCATGLLVHDDTILAVGGGGRDSGAVGDGEVQAGGVGGEEDGYGVELTGSGVFIWWEAELAVARNIDGDLEDFWVVLVGW